LRRLALIAAMIVLAATPARAAEVVPGNSCAGSVANSFVLSGGPENGGVTNGMFCNGGTNLYTGIINFQSTGKVGIGITSPSAKLHVIGGDTVTGIISSEVAIDSSITAISGNSPLYVAAQTNGNTAVVAIAYGNHASGASYTGYKTRAVTTAPTTAVANNDSILRLSARAADGTNFISAAFNQVEVDGTVSAGIVPTRYVWQTMDSTGSLAERLRLTSSGNVGIGTASPADMLDVEKDQNADTAAAVTNTTNGTGAQARMSLASGGNQLDIAATSSSNSGFAGAAYIWNEANTNLLFATNSTEWMRIGITGHLSFTGTTPAISACGTSPPAATGNDNAFQLTTGSGGPTACTATFGGAWATAPICIAQEFNGVVVVDVSAASTTAITLAFASGLTSKKVNVICRGTY
jgi:hypothetical protein